MLDVIVNAFGIRGEKSEGSRSPDTVSLVVTYLDEVRTRLLSPAEAML